jgi:NiFe hydrogenase small subunit HydA
MGGTNGSGNRRTVEKQYRELMEYCQVHLDQIEETLPEPRESFQEGLEARGVSRREFVKWTTFITGVLMLPPMFRPMVARAAENFSRLPVVWLNFAECTGCSESFLRSSYPNVDDILLDTISLEYHEVIMAASGKQAEENLKKAMTDFDGQYILVIEGAIPEGLDGKYLRIGSEGKTSKEIGKEVASKAAAVICIGSCSSFGNVQAAKPNPTDAKGIRDSLGIRTVNIAGCPPNPVNFVGTVLHFLMFGALPATDSLGRPLFAYGKRIHDYCERRAHYDAGEYVEEWGDAGAKRGWCLYKMGCKGPYTYGNCPKVRYNDGTSWPIMAGHGCMGCYEPAFWDTMAPLEKPITDDAIGVKGVEAKVNTVFATLAGLTVAGVAAHAAASAIKRHGPEEEGKKKAEKK